MPQADDEDFDTALTGQIGLANLDNMFDGSTEHAADAVDFEDEEELAEEEEESSKEEAREEPEEEEGEEEDDDFMKELQEEAMEGVEDDEGENRGGTIFDNNVTNIGLTDLDYEHTQGLDEHDGMGFAQDLEDEYDAETRRAVFEKKRLAARQKLLRLYYPTFKRGKPIRMQTLFPIIPLRYSYQVPPPIKRPLLPTKLTFEFQTDTRKAFRNATKLSTAQEFKTQQRIIEISETDLQSVQVEPEKPEVAKQSIQDFGNEIAIATADWDDDQIIEGYELDLPATKRLKLDWVDSDGWDDEEDELIFDGSLNMELLNLKLDQNDPHMLFTKEKSEKEEVAARKAILAKIPTNEKTLELRFKISNDKEYDQLRKTYRTKVRATIGNMNIDHSMPALKLQFPYYKVRLSEREMRFPHRPQFTVRPNTIMVFSKVKTRKKKRDKGKEPREIFKESSDLTLGDSANFFMLEYSEENPIVLNNFGMCSKLINYYRKLNEDDTMRPKLPVGETHVLGLQDRSPFWNFGYVEPGHIVPTLYNRMIRAPIFKHEPLSTDFLLIRSSGGGSSQRFFLRPVNYVFTVGQTLPVMEVPGPHSRKVTATSKNRLKMVVYRVLNRNEERRLLVRDIADHFPDQNDMQNRQRLKEFMEYQRSGNDQGYWKVKLTDTLPNYEEIRNIVSPEDIALLDAMQAGNQRLEDLDSYKRERLEDGTPNASLTVQSPANEAGSKKERDLMANDGPLSVQLAPWNITRNFVAATHGKAMLQIYGEGDPSGRGEAFSFLRTSMKGGFIKNAANLSEGIVLPPKNPEKEEKKSSITHTYNVAIQQKIYEKEIAKVWFKQWKALSKSRNSDKPRPVDPKELDDTRNLNIANETLNREVGGTEKPRYLKIVRMVKDSYGILQRPVEIVKDPKVVELYVKRRQRKLLEDPMELDTDNIVLTNDAEENKKVKKKLEEELAKLQKMQEKRKKKGLNTINIDSEGRISGKGIGKGKSTSRRCATCGALGHIRTNKTCPLYYTVHNKSNPNYIPGTEGAVDLLQNENEAPQQNETQPL
ncbi:hypothetical protein KL923_005139 [Ogataea haglerorum]|nr:hypothetical protein KL923_005139 [Ogataea haglerorum]